MTIGVVVDCGEVSLALVPRRGADAVAVVVTTQDPVTDPIAIFDPEGCKHELPGPQTILIEQQPPPRFRGQA